MKRKIVSLVLICSVLLGALIVPASASFSDIGDPDTAVAAAVLESMGIVTGTGPNTYSPGSTLTRAEFCTLVVRAMGLEDQAATYSRKTLFSDVAPGFWYAGYVNLAYSKGVINGYGNGAFGPDDTVTYGQVATILLRMLGYTSAEIGSVWPTDYTAYADDIDLSKGLSLDPYAPVTRGQAAVLLYHTLKATVNGNARAYYETVSAVASTATAIVLDNNAVNGSSSGLLMAYDIGNSSSVSYFSQKNVVSDSLVGYIGTLLLNSAGKTVGFIPDSTKYVDVTVSSAKASSITSASGDNYWITGSATVLYNGKLYTYNSTGYLQVDGQSGRKARIFYDGDGSVKYVYLSSGASSGAEAAVAETYSAAGELERKLGLSGKSYAISKNGAAASARDLGRYDVAYYDSATNTMYVSDYKVSGYIEGASPSVAAAETITVAGHSFGVMQSAWDTLKNFSVGSNVTLLLADDCKVAAVASASAVSAGMTGVLSTDGRSVTLAGSGIQVAAGSMSYAAKDLGGLVGASMTESNVMRCTAVGDSSAGKLDLNAKTLGSYPIAPSCDVYEWVGSGYVYSLSGVQGASSSDFDDIAWTTTLSSAYVSYYHLNSAGEVDVLLLKNVTGNCYDYGLIQVYPDAKGISLDSGYNTAATISNSTHSGESSKYLFTQFTPSNYYGSYVGIALSGHDSSYQQVISAANLTGISGTTGGQFFRDDDAWRVTLNGYEVPVGENVQVYIRSMDSWCGADGLLAVLESGLPLTVYYDRTLSTGAQVRVIVAD